VAPICQAATLNVTCFIFVADIIVLFLSRYVCERR